LKVNLALDFIECQKEPFILVRKTKIPLKKQKKMIPNSLKNQRTSRDTHRVSHLALMLCISHNYLFVNICQYDNVANDVN
jgi:hypothetical protein